MAAVRHLGFSKVENFNFRFGSEAQYASFAKIGQIVPAIWPIFDFHDGGRPPSWICFTRVATIHEEYLVVFVTVQNLVVNSAVIWILCKF